MDLNHKINSQFFHFPEYLNPKTTARIRIALIRQMMHFVAYLLLAH